MTVSELKELMESPKATSMELIVGKIMFMAIKHGDYSRVNALWDRSIGKVTDKIEHSLPRPTVYRHVDNRPLLPTPVCLATSSVAPVCRASRRS